MPNWCNNNISIKTTDEQSRKLMKDYEKYFEENLNQGKDLPPRKIDFLNWFHPVPKAAEGETFGWYNWCINNWGTKWDLDISDSTVEFEDIGDDNIELTFSGDSAWSPPVSFYEYMETLGFRINASWYEPGAGVIGEFNESYANDSYFSNPTGTLRQLYDYFNSSYKYINLDTDLEKLKAGDLINNEYILVSVRNVSWNEICDGQYDCIDNTLQRMYDADLDEACAYGQSVTEVVFTKSLKEPGEITGMYMHNKIYYSWEE